MKYAVWIFSVFECRDVFVVIVLSVSCVVFALGIYCWGSAAVVWLYFCVFHTLLSIFIVCYDFKALQTRLPKYLHRSMKWFLTILDRWGMLCNSLESYLCTFSSTNESLNGTLLLLQHNDSWLTLHLLISSIARRFFASLYRL